MIKRYTLLYFILLFFGCTQKKSNPEQKIVVEVDPKTASHQFLYGLWSLDKDSLLNNEGYLFNSDGSFNLVASEMNGNWEFKGSDSLILTFNTMNRGSQTETFAVDTITIDKLIISKQDVKHNFRKVPFGKNAEGIVLSGFMGTLAPGIKKEYTFNLQSAKQIKLELVTQEPGIDFQFFDGEHEITSVPVKSWEGIIIRGGSYRVLISRSRKGALSDEAADFNLKVIGF